ncbi:MAG: ABC transporter permease [Acidobacteriota bacterium]|nr:ABC transporter permease [Acidobacteriota bacterium]
MNNLVVSNFLHRPARSLVSVLGIAVGVLLIVFTVGLAEGSMRERASREANVNAEIFFRPSGAIGMSGNESFRLKIEQAAEVKKVDGVAEVIPIGQTTIDVQDSKTGQRLIDGIEFDSYSKLVNIRIIDGRKFADDADEVIVDTAFSSQKKFSKGSRITMWDREFTVVGTYEPAAGARVKTSLKTMQKQLGGNGRATAFLVKIKDGYTPEKVAENISKDFPNNQLILTKDLEELYMNAIPALGVFLNVIIGVAAVISALVILLTMYTTVTERTRQIGIMKSLGMSNIAIGWTITKEALLISLIGIAGGIALTFFLRWALTLVTTLEVQMSPFVIAIVFVVGLAGGALGGLYPAMRAARMEAVDALSYE